MHQDKPTRQRAHMMAGQLVAKALALGRDEDWVAEICGVEKASVLRWKKTGKGEASKVRKLEAAIGPIKIGPEEMANILLETYLTRKKPYQFTDRELFRIAGHATRRPAFIVGLSEILYDRGYLLNTITVKNATAYILISQAKLKALVPEVELFTAHHRVVAQEDTDSFDDSTVI